MPKAKRLEPNSPGEILAEEFMKPNGISQNRLSRDIDVNPAGINDIVHGRSAITAAIALRLGKYFWHDARAVDEFAGLIRAAAGAGRGLAKDWTTVSRSGGGVKSGEPRRVDAAG